MEPIINMKPKPKYITISRTITDKASPYHDHSTLHEAIADAIQNGREVWAVCPAHEDPRVLGSLVQRFAAEIDAKILGTNSSSPRSASPFFVYRDHLTGTHYTLLTHIALGALQS